MKITAVKIDIRTFDLQDVEIGLSKTDRGAFYYIGDGKKKYLPKEVISSYIPIFMNGIYVMVFDGVDYEPDLVNNGFINGIIASKENHIRRQEWEYEQEAGRLEKRIAEIKRKIEYFKTKLL